MSGRRRVKLIEAVEAIDSAGGTAIAVVCDVTQEDQQEQAIQTVISEFGRLDLAVANAGFAVSGRIERLSAADWRRQLDVNITGNVLRTSSDNMSVGTKLNKVDVVGGATFGSDTLVELRGDHISLEAKSKLSFQSSALEITLEPSKTTVKGHLRLEAGNQVDVAGSDDNLT